MTSNIVRTLIDERRAGLPNLVGSRLSVRIPLREDVLNAVIGRLLATQSTVEGLELRVLPANRLGVTAAVRVLGFRKSVRLALLVQPLIDRTTGWQGGLAFAERSLVSTLLATAAPFVSRLPPGVTLTDGGIVVRLPELLEHAGAGDLLPHVTRVMFESEDGTLWVRADVDVRQQDEPMPPSLPAAPRSPGAHPDLDVEQLQAWFHGAAADLRVRVSASLVNALVAAGLEDTVTAGPGGAARPVPFARVRPWLEHYVLSFEEGAMVVDVTGRVLD